MYHNLQITVDTNIERIEIKSHPLGSFICAWVGWGVMFSIDDLFSFTNM